MLEIDGPYFHEGHNVYRRVKVREGEEQFGDAEITEVEAWMAVTADVASARGMAEALNVRAACDWEYGVKVAEDDPTQVIHRRRLAFHTDWEPVEYDDLPDEAKNHFERPKR